MNSLLTRNRKSFKPFRFFTDDFEKGWTDLEDMVNSIFQPSGGSKYPRLDVADTEDSLIIEGTVPGLTGKDVNVEWYGNALVISAESVNKRNEEHRYISQEIHKSSFKRMLRVPDTIYDINSVSAKVQDGLLKIVISKIAQPKPEVKKINVE